MSAWASGETITLGMRPRVGAAPPLGILGIERTAFPAIQLLDGGIKQRKQRFPIRKVLPQRVRHDVGFGCGAPCRHLLPGEGLELRRNRNVHEVTLPDPHPDDNNLP
jgi:hypothetical protein